MKMAKDLKNAKEKLLTILDSLDAFVYVADMRTYEILFANKRARKLFGDIVGKVCWETIQAGQSGPCDFCTNKNLIDRDGQPVGAHTWENRNTRTGRWYEVRDCAVQWEDGRMVRLEIATDVTERKLKEKELLEARERAEKAVNLKDKFLALVVHDLRGPITNMVSFLKLLRYDVLDEAKKIELTGRTIKTGEKMLELIDKLLSSSRIKNGKMEPECTFFRVHRLGKDIQEDFYLHTGPKGVRLINKISEEARIYADYTLFYEVIRNLVSNAVKFCDQGDSITLFVPEEEPSTIAVADTGLGIENQRLDAIFQYGTVTSSPGTRGEGGAGLGLPLSLDIMKAHKGDLSVDTSPGRGSTFFARLPHVRPLVLLVEASQKDRLVTYECLRKVDADILEAETSEQGMELLQEKLPHLVITALMLPGRDGFWLVENIRKNGKTKNMPVIMLTSKTDLETNEKAMRVGANEFVAKPLVPGDFIPRVKKFLFELYQ